MCGLQVEELKSAQPNIVINNSNVNTNTNTNVAGVYGAGKQKNKWVALALCFFLGVLGAHRFYEGKVGTGILYFFTWGIFGIGALIDFFILLFKPNPYYV
ncbi:TM2 domain-containing protein [Paenibacillus lycopersici]|uniref:TM2 domain-containing protein n=2 Tax=Paenibacillus lycopersici TaxID=2704462 RepID=A0A6C0G7Y3_9BACL|nr:TM2 domain-containing protein [Paenibacillus lycopersici]